MVFGVVAGFFFSSFAFKTVEYSKRVFGSNRDLPFDWLTAWMTDWHIARYSTKPMKCFKISCKNQNQNKEEEKKNTKRKRAKESQSVYSFIVIDSVAVAVAVVAAIFMACDFGWVHHFEPPARSYLIRSIGSAIYFMIIVLIRPISCVYFVNFVCMYFANTPLRCVCDIVRSWSTYIYSHICLLAYPQ